MPVYQYRCTACRHEFEVMQTMQEPPVAGCERCGKAVTKLISASGLVFKGSGWYITDYGSRRPSESPAGTSKKTESNKKTEADQKTEAGKTTEAGKKTETAPSGGSPSDGGSAAEKTTPRSPGPEASEKERPPSPKNPPKSPKGRRPAS